jgi:hypothetical protein
MEHVPPGNRHIDLDGNGRVSFKELCSWLGRVAKGMSAREVYLILSAIDTDGDEELDIHEIRAAFRDSGANSSALLGTQGQATVRPVQPGRWQRVRRRKIARLMARIYPDAVSCYQALGGFRGSVSTGGGIAASQWHKALQELFRMARAPLPTSEQSLEVFKDVCGRESHMSFAALEKAFFFQPSSSSLHHSSATPPHPGAPKRGTIVEGRREGTSFQERRGGVGSSVPGSLLAAVKLLASRAGHVQAACSSINGGGARLKRSQLLAALVRAGVHLEPQSLQAILDYSGQGSGAVDVDRLLHKCCNSAG